MVISFYQDFTSSFHCGDCYYERDTGIGDFEERDSGNNHLNEPRTGMSVNESLYRLSRIREAVGLLSDTLQLLRGNKNFMRSEVAYLSKILNGPQGNVN